MSTEKTPKNAPKYYCEKCDFGCNKLKIIIDILTRQNINTDKSTIQQKNTKKHRTIIM